MQMPCLLSLKECLMGQEKRQAPSFSYRKTSGLPDSLVFQKKKAVLAQKRCWSLVHHTVYHKILETHLRSSERGP